MAAPGSFRLLCDHGSSALPRRSGRSLFTPTPAVESQPQPIAGSILTAAHLLGPHAVELNFAIIVIQLALGIGLVWRRRVKLALACSIVWALWPRRAGTRFAAQDADVQTRATMTGSRVGERLPPAGSAVTIT